MPLLYSLPLVIKTHLPYLAVEFRANIINLGGKDSVEPNAHIFIISCAVLNG